MVNTRIFDLEKDYETIQKWAESRGLDRVEKLRLSHHGLMAFKEQRELAACFLFPFKGSEFCMFEFLITNPESSSEERDECMTVLFTGLCENARDMGYKEIFTTSFLPSVSNKLNSLGFVKNEVPVNHFVGRLV